MRRLPVFLTLLLACALLSVVVAVPVTRYVTMTGAGTTDGTSAANACNGFTGSCATPAGDDTYYLCGAWTAWSVPTQSGTSGHRITYDGSCPGGTAATITGTGTSNAISFPGASGSRYLTLQYITYATTGNAHGVLVDGDDDITFDHMTCTGTGDSSKSCISLLGSVACDRIVVSNSSLSSAGYYGISYQVTGTSLTIVGPTATAVTCTNNGSGCIRWTIESAAYSTSKWSAPSITYSSSTNDGNTTSGAGFWIRTGDTSLDPAGYAIWSAGVVIAYNTVTGLGRTLGAAANPINCGGCDGASVHHNTLTNNEMSGGQLSLLSSKNSVVYANSTDTSVSANGIDGGGIFNDTYSDNNIYWGNQIKNCDNAAGGTAYGEGLAVFSGKSNVFTGNIVMNCRVGFMYSGVRTDLNVVTGNTFYNATAVGIGKGTVQPTVESTAVSATNNIVTGAAKCLQSFGNPPTGDYNDCYNSPYDASWPAGSHDQTVDPLWVGGSTPSGGSGFRLKSTSTLRRAGLDANRGSVMDYGGRAFLRQPSIGAWESVSGDAVDRSVTGTRSAAGTRAFASTRTAR